VENANSQTAADHLPKHEILFRDWKDQADAQEIDEAIQRVSDGQNAPRIYDTDTGQDAYAIIVSAAPMTPEQVQAAWEASFDDE
jgi:hypothetical protein